MTSSDKDANIYVRANIVDVEGNSKLSSGILRLRIRDKNIQVISKATDVTGDFSVSNSYDVGDEAGVSFRFFSRDPDMVWR